jgi:hypothetical protein
MKGNKIMAAGAQPKEKASTIHGRILGRGVGFSVLSLRNSVMGFGFTANSCLLFNIV